MCAEFTRSNALRLRESRSYLTESVHKVVLQKSIPERIRLPHQEEARERAMAQGAEEYSIGRSALPPNPL